MSGSYGKREDNEGLHEHEQLDRLWVTGGDSFSHERPF